MSHFAQIDNNNIVRQVLVVEQDVIDTGALGDPRYWIQTSYNTHAGQHKLGGTPLRKNYAGLGYRYDATRDAFIPPVPFEGGSWILDEDTCLWKRPIPYPEDGKYYAWDMVNNVWVESANPLP